MASTDSEKNIKRRRILKAAASAPVVFTLPTGAALAATSISCAVKSTNRATSTTETVFGVTTEPDDWMRFSLPGVRINQSGGLGQVNGFNLGGTWYAVNADGTVTAVTAVGVPQPNGRTYYALVDYDAYSSGQAASMYVYHGGTGVVSPIAGASCWNSLTGSALSPPNVIN